MKKLRPRDIKLLSQRPQWVSGKSGTRTCPHCISNICVTLLFLNLILYPVRGIILLFSLNNTTVTNFLRLLTKSVYFSFFFFYVGCVKNFDHISSRAFNLTGIPALSHWCSGSLYLTFVSVFSWSIIAPICRLPQVYIFFPSFWISFLRPGMLLTLLTAEAP